MDTLKNMDYFLLLTQLIISNENHELIDVILKSNLIEKENIIFLYYYPELDDDLFFLLLKNKIPYDFHIVNICCMKKFQKSLIYLLEHNIDLISLCFKFACINEDKGIINFLFENNIKINIDNFTHICTSNNLSYDFINYVLLKFNIFCDMIFLE